MSVHIAAAVAEVAFADGLAGVERPADLLELARAHVWAPRYASNLV